MYLLNVSSSHILYLENDELTEQSDDAQCILIYDISMDTGVMVNLNVVPLPFSDVKLMCPPNHSIIHLINHLIKQSIIQSMNRPPLLRLLLLLLLLLPC